MKDFFFAAKQCVLSFFRCVFSFAAGGTECVVCGAHSKFFPICDLCKKECFARISSYGEGRCTVCGKLLVSEHGMCMQCRRERVLVHTDAVFPLFSYRLWNSVLLFCWKINGVRALSPFFAERLAAALKTLPPFEAVVPVPPRSGKIRKKGWDQIVELCEFLALRYKFSVCALLVRESRDEQKTLSKSGRLGAIGNAYRMKTGKALKKALHACGGSMPRTVCLIDDVMTTGATIESCAAALKGGGVETVHVATLFIVD